MASVNAQIRWADNTAELKQRLSEGIGVIDAMKQAVDRTATSMGGQGLFMQANKLTAAIDQLGGVTKLTASEQDRATATLDKAIDKYKVMGMTAPPAMLELRDAMKGAGDGANEASGFFDKLFNSFAAHVAEGMLLRDALREVMSFAKDAITDTAKIEDLAKATGMSMQAVQQFGYVGQEFGIENETMARAVEQFSAKLANGDKNATKAVESLGLSVKNLIAEGPKDAFLDFADAAGRVEDPMTKIGLVTEGVGGRLAKQLIPALGELREKMDAVPKSAIISDENVKQAHDFDVGLQHLETQLKATTIALLGWIAAAAKSAAAPGMEEGLTIGAAADERFKNAAAANDIVLPKEAVTQVTTNADVIANRLKALKAEALDPLTAAQQANILALHKWGEAETDIAKLVGSNTVAVHTYLEAQKSAAHEIEQFQKAQENLMPVLTDPAWNGSIDSMLKLGGSVHDTAVYFGESEGVIRRHKDAMETWSKVVKEEAGESLDDLQSKFGKGIPEKFFTDTAKTIGELEKIESGARFSAKELGGMGEAAKPSLEDLNATFGTIGLNFDKLEKESIAGLQHTADISRETYEFMAANNDMFSDRVIKNAKLRADADQAAADSTLTNQEKINDALGLTIQALDATGNKWAKMGGEGIQAVQDIAKGFEEGGVWGAVIAGIGDGIKMISQLFGGPSKDELAARSTFASFQQQFGTLTQTIDAVGDAYAKVGKTGTEAQADLKAALDATHVSAEAEASALAKINDVLDQAKNRAQLLQSTMAGVTQGLSVGTSAIGTRDSLTAQISTTTDPKQLETLQAQLRQTTNLIDATVVHSQTAASAIAASIVGITNANMKAGMSFTDAVKAAAPAVEALQTQLKMTGLSGGATFDFLRQEVALASDAIGGPALQSIHGYTQGLQGLSDAGMLDQQTFAGLASQIGGTEQALLKQGYSAGTVSVAMKGDLQTLWQMEQQYGYKADDVTQSLIDQGVQSGLIGEQGKSDNQKILDVLVLIGKALGADIPKDLDTLGDKSKVAAKTAADNLNTIPRTFDISVNVNYNDPGFTPNVASPDVGSPDGASTGGYVTAAGIQHFGGGGMVLPFRPMGTDTVPAMLTPGEMVLTKRQQRAVFGSGSAPAIDMSEFKAMRSELQSLRAEQSAAARRLPAQLAAAVTSSLLQAREGRK